MVQQPTHPSLTMTTTTTTRCALREQGSQAKCQGQGASLLQRQVLVPQAAR
jgi:hypothetical protein